jgi:hypothetical protein
LAGLVIAPDYKQALARGSIPPRRIVVGAAIAHIEAIHDSVAHRTAALNYSAAHRNIVKEWNRERPGLACGLADVTGFARRSFRGGSNEVPRIQGPSP